jgi:hypothetical protein
LFEKIAGVLFCLFLQLSKRKDSELCNESDRTEPNASCQVPTFVIFVFLISFGLYGLGRK